MKSARWVSLLAVLSLVGCLRGPEEAPGGLTIEDFEPISANGLDAADHAQDSNDYPWSMEYFVPDGADQGHLYVGTWNRVQQWKGFQEHKAVYPEIRRYRPDISANTWETVLDTRDYDLTDVERPHGFRIMKVYTNQSDGKTYLYAGGRGDQTDLWRSETGEPGTWERFWAMDREGSIRGMALHNGLLYMSFFNDYTLVSDSDEPPCVILATDGQDVWTVSDDGFGNSHNQGIFTIASFNGWLYAGTHNPMQGGQVWKLEGPDPDEGPVCVVRGGGPRLMNEAAITMHVYDNHLYIGMVANHILRMIGGLRACDLIRLDENDEWETVAGPFSIGGERSGFGEDGNSYIWSMCEHDGWFYVGTYDIVTGLTYMLTHPDYLLGMMGVNVGGSEDDKCLTLIDLAIRQPNAGGDLYKTQDGVTWYCVSADGFGDHNNYGLRNMESVGGRLFVGMSNPFDGLEMWASPAP